jgi:nucleotide-binding universal stress UspA family protein
MTMYQRILVATDGTEHSCPALETALALARVGGGAIVGVHACAPMLLDPEEMQTSDPIDGTWRRERVQLAHDAMAYIKRRAHEEGVAVITELGRQERPHEAIIAAAQAHGCDLIVMASHGESGVAARVLGSETRKVLTHCAIPVLVVR